MANHSITFKAAIRLGGIALALATGPAMAQTAPDSGCSALAAETISLTGAAATATHSTGAVPLRAGETLHLQITAPPGEAATGAILVADGGEAGEPIISGAAPQQAAYTVAMDGMYSLEFRADGRNELTFEVSCDAGGALPAPLGAEAFMQRSAARLLADDTAQASLQRRAAKPQSIDQAVKTVTVMGADGNPTQITVATSAQNIAAAEGKVFAGDKLDIWAEARVSQSQQRVEENGTKYGIEAQGGTLYLGSDYLLRPGLMIGGLLQFDQYRESYDAFGAGAANHGVMFGPYASVRLAPDVFFDARAAWGTAEAETETLNGTRFAFDTERQLLRGALTGNRSLYGVKFTPSVALAVVESRLADPAALPAGSFAEESSVIGRLGLGSGMSTRIALDDGSFLQPNAALSTGWNVDTLDNLALAGAHVSNEGGAKAEAGLMLGTADGISVQATGAVEGIGKDDYSAWSGRLSVTAPLN
jgi:Autotransporter beta-domain